MSDLNNYSVVCPRCGNTIAQTRYRNDIVKVACKKCNKWIWINPVTKVCHIKEIPPRTESSGKRFY